MTTGARRRIAWAVVALTIVGMWVPSFVRAERTRAAELRAIATQPAPEILGAWVVPAWSVARRPECERERPSGCCYAPEENGFEVFLHGRDFLRYRENVRDGRLRVLVEGEAAVLHAPIGTRGHFMTPEGAFDPTPWAVLFRVDGNVNAFLQHASTVELQIVSGEATSHPFRLDLATALRELRERPALPRVRSVAVKSLAREAGSIFALVDRPATACADGTFAFDDIEPDPTFSGISLGPGPHPSILSGRIPLDRLGETLPVGIAVDGRTVAGYRYDTTSFRRQLEEASRVDLSYKGPSPTRSLVPHPLGPPALLDLLLTIGCLLVFRVWKARGPVRWLLAFTAPALLCGLVALGLGVLGPSGFPEGLLSLFLLVWMLQLVARGFIAGLITGLAFQWAHQQGP